MALEEEKPKDNEEEAAAGVCVLCLISCPGVAARHVCKRKGEWQETTDGPERSLRFLTRSYELSQSLFMLGYVQVTLRHSVRMGHAASAPVHAE